MDLPSTVSPSPHLRTVMSAPNREAHGVSTYVLDTGSQRVAARVNRRDGELVADDPVSAWQVANILTGLRLS